MFCLFFSLIAGLLSTAQAEAPLWPDLSSPPTVGGGENDAAVIVAIEDYSFVSDVAGARQNGEDWYRYLTQGRGVPGGRVSLLIDSQATLGNIQNALVTMKGQVQPGGTLWFVFIGHGAPSMDGKDGLLLEVDVRNEALSIYDRSLSQSALLAHLRDGTQDRTVLLLDACFSGQLSGSGAPLADGELQPLIPSYTTPSAPETFTLTASQSDQFAGTLPGARRPAFSYLMLGALYGWGDTNRDGSVTAQEAIDYGAAALRGVLTNRQQTPQLHGYASNASLSRAARREAPSIEQIRLRLYSPPPPPPPPPRVVPPPPSPPVRSARQVPTVSLSISGATGLIAGGSYLFMRRNERLYTDAVQLIEAGDRSVSVPDLELRQSRANGWGIAAQVAGGVSATAFTTGAVIFTFRL